MKNWTGNWLQELKAIPKLMLRYKDLKQGIEVVVIN